MTKPELIQKTAEYVISLPDRSHWAMRDAVAAVCPDENFGRITTTWEVV